jgi:signal transduction histidine kinase/DNA-binding response OmpR family regulator/ligand-binding sensor domain-containing protein
MKNYHNISVIKLLMIIFFASFRTSYATAIDIHKYSVTYFSAKNGYEDGLVNDIIQDKKGLLWFATWNGLYRYDGYTFKNYKSNIKDKVGLTNDRLLNIYEDKFGFIWVYCYDATVYRFNPNTEIFEPIVSGGNRFGFKSINVLPDGNTWLLRRDGSAIRISINPDNLKLIIKSYSSANGTLPSGNIKSIYLDTKGREWLLTDNGLYFIYRNRLITAAAGTPKNKLKRPFFSAFENDKVLMFGGNYGKIYILKNNVLRSKSLGTNISVISILRLGQKIFYVADKNGFYISDLSMSHSAFISIDQIPKLKNETILSAQIIGGLLWLTHPCPGATMYDINTHKLKHYEIKDETGCPLNTEKDFFAFKDKFGTLWVHPKNGGFSYFDTKKEMLIPFNTTKELIKWESNDRCLSAFSDKQGNLWMGTQMDRLKRITFLQENIHLYTPYKNDMELPGNEIRALFIDRCNRLWTGTRDGNISIYNSQMKLITHFKAGRVYAIMQDSSDKFWISTKGDGLKMAVESSPGKFKITQFLYSPKDKYSLSCNNIYYTFEDRKKNIWVATYGGGLDLLRCQHNKPIRFISYRNTLKNYPINRFGKLRHVTEDLYGHIWVSTTSGILIFSSNFNSPQSIKFHSIIRVQGKINSLSNNDVQMIKCMNNGRSFAITYGGGLNELVQNGKYTFKCKSFTRQNGLVSDIIYSLYEDCNGDLWLATGGGPVKFIIGREQIQYPIEHADFNLHFSEGVGVKWGEQILFGTNKGILYFSPENMYKNNFIPRIFFSSIWVNNKELAQRQEPSILKTSIDNMSEIKLPPNNHTLRLVFSALDMSKTEYIKYAYMLEGFDKSYQLAENGHEADYTNLPPGHYKFHIVSTNAEGVWCSNERVLTIDVEPTFNQTLLAKLIYTTIIIALIFIGIYIYLTFYKMKNEIKNEEYISKLKLKFFTNISHELRTPLTLISGPLEFILKNEILPDKIKKALITMKRNSDRMQRLIGDILDFNKIQSNKMKLRIQELDIVDFVKKNSHYFDNLAQERNITFSVTSEMPECFLWFDPNHIEEVLFNIISNAFKYTKDGKKLCINISEDIDYIYIKVSDEGIGIPEEKLGCIFSRYENLVQRDINIKNSSGIGLSLAKELVEMHHGNITVESKIGRGSTFCIKLPKELLNYSSDYEYILSDIKEDKSKAVANQCDEENDKDINDNDSEKQLILIVEDNQELRSFIKYVFEDKFNIIEAENGEDGYIKAIKHLPDIILTDIMMPVKDGISMLQELRNDERTSHIPAIVLTAKTDIDNIIIGINTGADDYITKPFSVRYLQAKVNTLLKTRKNLQLYYSKNPLISNISSDKDKPLLSDKDRNFLEKLSQIMEQQISNSELSIDDLVSNFNLSRTNFFHKLKSLTGLSPVLYIREVRMRKAVELIDENQYTMAEIAYKVGFNDPHYFSKTFKAYWGKNATEYRKL